MGPFKDIAVATSGFVSLVEIRRPPHNFFDASLIREIADALEALDQDPSCRAVVLASQGTAFCAGSNFGDGGTLDREGQRPGEHNQPIGRLYMEGVRLFSNLIGVPRECIRSCLRVRASFEPVTRAVTLVKFVPGD